jgi:hypothetical protein
LEFSGIRLRNARVMPSPRDDAEDADAGSGRG